ncbi:SDR family NAD(P)-dependent oxidoreductase [Nocardia grenadensis]|uniref:SDR family NAD(P)-dependent oxidoreductase n=1 Tax=Nocardia grenadensis TaxID=931537 RepID=UPI0007A3ED15|nr:SDR family NAD(P)-dependent oxidoreductase [Nocardia grenadensis]
MTGLLDGRRILVTGALGGIGTAVTRLIESEGGTVVGIDRPESVARAGAPAAYGLDLTAAGATARVQQLCRELGGIDGLVNNAGIEYRAALGEHTDDDWSRVMAVNLDVPFRLGRDLAGLLESRVDAAIVNICSIAVTGFAGQVAYDASKGGLQTLTRSLAVELGPRGIRANAICPGFIDTPMLDTGSLRGLAAKVARGLPLRRLGIPDDIGHAVVWLLSGRSRYITGQSLYVDGGMTRS